MKYINKDIYLLEEKLSLASQVGGHFLLETKLLWAWSEQLNKFIQNVNKQYENNLNTLMDEFTDGQHLRTRKTSPVVVTKKDHGVSIKVYTESLTKNKKAQVYGRL